MIKKIFKTLFVSCLVVFLVIFWKLYKVRAPFQFEEIPRWRVQEISNEELRLTSIDNPDRFTTAWVKNNPNDKQCDTLILVGGAKEGKNLIAQTPTDHVNLVAFGHPIMEYFKIHPWKKWSWLEWWNSPEQARREMIHTVGALQALIDYTYEIHQTNALFSNRIVLAGGSYGAPFAGIVTSFRPQKIAGLAIIYGFTNFVLVLQGELFEQGKIHFNLMENHSKDPLYTYKIFGVRVLGYLFGWLAGNIIKYGEIEHYLPQIYNTPIFFLSGRHDHMVPRAAYDPMWNAAPEPKYEKWIDGDHIDPKNPKALQYVVSALSEWGNQQGLLKCRETQE